MDNITTKEMGQEPQGSEYNMYTEKDAGKVYGGPKEKPDPSTLVPDEDGIKPFVTPDMIIGDIITWYPDTALVLMKCGMHCISCGISQFETLDQACAVHGLYVDDVAKVVNDYLTQTLDGPKSE
ncbi:MAG: DUF1858 domain-containing protein [Eubacterium sp.]|nr:DUF1858 domain-containing protein [Eubacterium sp.]